MLIDNSEERGEGGKGRIHSSSNNSCRCCCDRHLDFVVRDERGMDFLFTYKKAYSY